MRRAGITMIELLIASVIGIVIMLALGNMDSTRVYLSDQIRRSSSSLSEASLAVSLAVRDIQQADRVVLLNPTSVQVRIPLAAAASNPPASLDNPANYKWVQYKSDGINHEIVLYDPPCTARQRFGRCRTDESGCFSGLEISYVDASPAPPGGDPPNQDNNTQQFKLSWRDIKTNVTQDLIDQATMRASAYTNLADPGLLIGAGSTPPGGC